MPFFRKDSKSQDKTGPASAGNPRNPSEGMPDPDSYVYRRPGKKAAPEEADRYVYPSGGEPSAPQEQDAEPRRRGIINSPDLKSDGEVYRDLSQTDPSYWDKTLEKRYEMNYPAERRILLRNIRKVGAIILAMFLGLMSYLVYFQSAKAPDLRADAGNRRNAEARNRVLRGSIFDRNGDVLSESVLHDDGTQTREYPGGEAFGNILGYVSDKYSITGLELALDKSLSRNAGLESVLSPDFFSSLLNPEQAVTRKQEGYSVKLTLDQGLQDVAYEALDGRKGSVVALDPKTGEILAMVSSPGFSAANLDEVMDKVNSDEDYAAKAPLINRALNSLYAPGSTMKVVTLASALENLPGLEKRVFDDKGVIEFPDGSRIRNFNDNVYGEMDLQESFANSSNYVFGNLGMELSNAQLRATAEGFGFNQDITMNGLSVRQSVFPKLGDNEDGNKALSALGQGEVAATPLQIAMVSSAVANKGQLASPHIVDRILDKDGVTISRENTVFSDALDPAIAAKVADLMAGNVEVGGSAYQSLADIDGAGKTGTGQFAVGDGTRVNAWFTGFAPKDDPEIAIAVILEDLKDVNENTGARQALPVAREVMTWWLDQ